MPRKVRVEYSGVSYHIMSRGNRRENIFHNEVDRQDFFKTLAETCLKADVPVHAYCLIGSEEFKKRMLEKMDEMPSVHHSGELRRQR